MMIYQCQDDLPNKKVTNLIYLLQYLIKLFISYIFNKSRFYLSNKEDSLGIEKKSIFFFK